MGQHSKGWKYFLFLLFTSVFLTHLTKEEDERIFIYIDKQKDFLREKNTCRRISRSFNLFGALRSASTTEKNLDFRHKLAEKLRSPPKKH